MSSNNDGDEVTVKHEEDEPPNYPCPFCAVVFHNNTSITRHVARCSMETTTSKQQASNRPDMKPFVGRTSSVAVVDLLSDDEIEEDTNDEVVIKEEQASVSYTTDECLVIEKVS
jgi:uncharacterized C2H2 Zn-finger protein